MKKAILAVCILFLMPLLSHSHPGKTNRYGGHRCLKDCETWGLFYDEYHLHDKDGRPIRVGKRRKAITPRTTGLVALATTTAAPESIMTEITKTVVVTNYRHVTNVYEENLLLSHPLIYVVLILLLLLLIIRMNRNKEREVDS